MKQTELTELTDLELKTAMGRFQAEADRRRAIEKELELKAAIERAAIIHSVLPALLLITEHGRSSCSDTDLQNAYANEMGYPRCNRCFMLAALREGTWDPYVDLEVVLRPKQ